MQISDNCVDEFLQLCYRTTVESLDGFPRFSVVFNMNTDGIWPLGGSVHRRIHSNFDIGSPQTRATQ